MVPSAWNRLNRYGKTVVGSTVLGLVVLIATGSPRAGVLVFVGIAGATTVTAMYRRSPDAERGQQPGDRTTGSEDTDRQEKELEARKAASDGYFSK